MTSHFAGKRAQKLNTAVCQLKLFFHPSRCVPLAVHEKKVKRHKHIRESIMRTTKHAHDYTQSHAHTLFRRTHATKIWCSDNQKFRSMCACILMHALYLHDSSISIYMYFKLSLIIMLLRLIRDRHIIIGLHLLACVRRCDSFVLFLF